MGSADFRRAFALNRATWLKKIAYKFKLYTNCTFCAALKAFLSQVAAEQSRERVCVVIQSVAKTHSDSFLL